MRVAELPVKQLGFVNLSIKQLGFITQKYGLLIFQINNSDTHFKHVVSSGNMRLLSNTVFHFKNTSCSVFKFDKSHSYWSAK